MTETRGLCTLGVALLCGLAGGSAAGSNFPAAPSLVEAAASEQPELGARLYRQHCRSCHGAQGRGDGPLADGLRFRPADLTGLSRRAGGRFPTKLVTRIVDGRRAVPGHGGPEMPVWGDILKEETEGYAEDPVRRKVRAIVEHLEFIQETEWRGSREGAKR